MTSTTTFPVTQGNAAAVTCQSTYTQVGADGSVTCNDGSFQLGSLPSCKAKCASAPSLGDNTGLTTNPTYPQAHNSQLTVQCTNDYVGASVDITCTDGSWSTARPTCKAREWTSLSNEVTTA